MLTSMESFLRRGQRAIRRWGIDPRVRGLGMGLCWGIMGFLLSAGSLLGYCQPLAMGAICSRTGGSAAIMSLGAGLGYWVFWGESGIQGTVWSAAAGALALMLGQRIRVREAPGILPAIAAFLTAMTGLAFQLLLGDRTPVRVYCLRILEAFLSALVFTQAAQGRRALTDWLAGGVLCLCLAQVAPVPWMNLGAVFAGTVAVTAPLPGTVLAGLGLDLGRITALPMTAVLSLGWMLRMIPFRRKWLRWCLPAISFSMVAALEGVGDGALLPGLLLGGFLGGLLPPRPQALPRRGDTGAAQVRLELGATALAQAGRFLSHGEEWAIDRDGILRKALDRACGGCSCRKTCPEQGKLTLLHLENPLEADCRKQGRLIPELRRAQEQVKLLTLQHRRREEYRQALARQYTRLGAYLRSLSDSLPRRGTGLRPSFRVEAAARTLGREGCSADRCLAFPGGECRYYVLLCDGMGTGPGAAREGQGIAELLQAFLAAGFSAAQALECLNELLTLGAKPGAVTVDLAELDLDTGCVNLYKWGAAPSWLLKSSGAEKIGTAAPPPGISLGETWERVEKLSLRRGEVLVLLSDGADGEDYLRRLCPVPDGPPGELAAKLLGTCRGTGEDDATAVVIRLRPVSLSR